LRAFVFLLILSLGSPAWAQLRSIPKDAHRAKIRHVQANLIELDGRQKLLAPGAQIRDASNRIIVPSAVPAGALVKYRLDASGQVGAVWILTGEEAKK
jgi:hypothetical protein